MPWTPTQSGNLFPAASRFFPNAVILNNAGASQSITGTGSGIFIPFSNLESYKQPTSGDIRELIYSILDVVFTGIVSLSGLPDQPKPSNFTITRSLSLTSDTTAEKRYTVVCGLTTANTKYDVSEE
jgi:hypothetical protein